MLCRLSLDLLRFKGFDSRLSSVDTAEYSVACGRMRMKYTEPIHRPNVPAESRTSNDEVSSGNAITEMVVKKKAPKPNAESGKAVAVPR